MNKYHAKTAYADGIRFSSQLERNRYIELKRQLDLGLIKDLHMQVRYEVIPRQNGERAAYYVADFVYENEKGEIVVEDTKGRATPDYVLKRKLMLHVHGIKIQEVYRNGKTSHRKKHRQK